MLGSVALLKRKPCGSVREQLRVLCADALPFEVQPGREGVRVVVKLAAERLGGQAAQRVDLVGIAAQRVVRGEAAPVDAAQLAGSVPQKTVQSSCSDP